MSKIAFYGIILAATAMVLAPLGLYFDHFDGSLSNDSGEWANFAVFAGVAAAPLNSLVVLVLVITLHIQRNDAATQLLFTQTRELQDSVHRYLDFTCEVHHAAIVETWPIRAHLAYMVVSDRYPPNPEPALDEVVIALRDTIIRIESALAALDNLAGGNAGPITDVYRQTYQRYQPKIEEFARLIERRRPAVEVLYSDDN